VGQHVRHAGQQAKDQSLQIALAGQPAIEHQATAEEGNHQPGQGNQAGHAQHSPCLEHQVVRVIYHRLAPGLGQHIAGVLAHEIAAAHTPQGMAADHAPGSHP